MGYEREEIQKKAKAVREGLMQNGIQAAPGLRHITPVQVGDSALCSKLCQVLLEEEKIYLQPINYPSVRCGEERVRITVTRLHTDDMVSSFVEKFARAWHKVMVSMR